MVPLSGRSQQLLEFFTFASVASAVGDAVTAAGKMSEYVTSVASALEQQRTATREISGSAQHASAALNDINMRVKMIAA